MPLYFVREDITRFPADAIVNAANESLLGGGGVDGAIHRAAGPDLLKECRTLNGCRTGEAKITGGYRLPAKHVIHTVGPIYRDGKHGEEALLRSCYRNSLLLARENHLESIAFPLISAGVYGYPKDQALSVAVDEIRAFLLEDDMDMQVTLVLYDRSVSMLSKKLYCELKRRIDDAFAGEHYNENTLARRLLASFRKERPGKTGGRRREASMPMAEEAYKEVMPEAAEASYEEAFPEADEALCDAASSAEKVCEKDGLTGTSKAPALPMASMSFDTAAAGSAKAYSAAASPELRDMLNSLDETFTEMLLRKIDENRMSDAECYKKANIDRKLFSKIRSNPAYRPKKTTVLAFAIALRLSLPETEEMLKKAGFALSMSNKTDIIIRYFIEHGNYSIFDINEALYEFDQMLLGA